MRHTLKAIVTAPWRGVKALRLRWQRTGYRLWLAPRSKFDFLGSVGDGTGSATVMAPILWIARTFPEAPPRLRRKLGDGQLEQVRDHPLLRLLERPNPYFSGAVMWMATLMSWNVDGNAYWLKIRGRGQRPAELWWVPHWAMTPVGDEDRYLTHYNYRVGGITTPLNVEDVVHFRFGLDPDNPREGASPLKSVLREVFTDDEAANFTASLLRNMGVPGLMISPDSPVPPTPEDVAATKQYMRDQFGGDNRGEPLVMSGPTKIQQFGFSPEQMNLRALRRIPEERVTAVLGLPAVVAGLGAGLDRSTFTNMGEAREMAYVSNIIPTQRLLGEEIRHQLLGDFESDPWSFVLDFDLTEVRVLQEDRAKQAQRLSNAVVGGWMSVAEARREAGLPVSEAHDVFLRPLNLLASPADAFPDPTLEPELRRRLTAATAALGVDPATLLALNGAAG